MVKDITGDGSPENTIRFNESNPNVTRFTRGMNVRIPTYRDRENRGQRNNRAQAAPVKLGPTVTADLPSYTPLPRPAGAPEGFDIPATRRFRGRPGMEFTPRYTPEIPENYDNYVLPQEGYEYFYGENPRIKAEQRNAARRAAQLAEVQAARAQADREAQAEQARQNQIAVAQGTDERRFRQGQYGDRFAQTNDRRFEQGQYGDRFGENEFRDNPLSDTIPYSAIALRNQNRYRREVDRFRNPPDMGTRRFQEGQYGANLGYGNLELLDPKGTGGTIGEVTGGAPEVYTTDWLQSWLEATDPADMTPEQLYMLQVVGAIEPTTPSGGGGYGGGGRYYPRRYGGGGGGGGYGGAGYGTSADRGSQYTRPGGLGLVSWRI